MASKNPSIKHIEVSGIKLDVDISRFNDQRFTYLIGKATAAESRIRNTSDEAEKIELGRELLSIYPRMVDFLFGDAYSIMNRLADGGHLSPERWNEFVSEVMEAANAKN